MNNQDLLAKLKELDACQEAIDFCQGKDFKTAWTKCVRADWILWFICRMEIGTRRDRTHVICDCAATALKYVPRGEDRPRLAIEAARKYANKPTPENLNKLNVAAWAAEATAGASWETGTAARNAARVVGAAARAAGSKTWDTAWAAGSATGDAVGATGAASHKKMCKMIRKKISIKGIE